MYTLFIKYVPPHKVNYLFIRLSARAKNMLIIKFKLFFGRPSHKQRAFYSHAYHALVLPELVRPLTLLHAFIMPAYGMLVSVVSPSRNDTSGGSYPLVDDSHTPDTVTRLTRGLAIRVHYLWFSREILTNSFKNATSVIRMTLIVVRNGVRTTRETDVWPMRIPIKMHTSRCDRLVNDDLMDSINSDLPTYFRIP